MRHVAATVMALLLIPLSAIARMDSLTMEDMENVTGKVGMTMDLTWQLTDSYLAWTDDDGFDYTTTGSTLAEHTGALTLDGLKIDNGNSTPGAISIDGITLDVGTSSNNTSYLCVGLPQIQGRLTVTDVLIGRQAAQGGSIGAVYVGDFNMASSSIRISAH